MILAILFALLPRVQIVAGNETTVTYRELVPVRVPIDPQRGTFRLSLQNGHYTTLTEKRVPHDPAHIAVLFLGNSLTYFNEMPRMTQAIGAREKRPLFVEAVTQSGATLEDLWFRTDAIKRIWQEHWDYVVLQERGGKAAMDRGELFHQYLMMFANEARKSGAVPLLLQTWYPGNEAFFKTAARRANAGLLPVGTAWQNLLARGEFERLDWDGTHPNVAGSYLIACSLYVAVYGRPPAGVPFDFRHLADPNEFYDAPLLSQSLNEEQATAIQRAAWRAKNP